MSLWESDLIQFARLIAEIKMAGLTADQVHDLKESMDITSDQLQELMDRAEEAFERHKERVHGTNQTLVTRMVFSELDLDELVNGDFSERAASLNNQGREAQAEYILEQWGEEAVLSFLEEQQ